MEGASRAVGKWMSEDLLLALCGMATGKPIISDDGVHIMVTLSAEDHADLVARAGKEKVTPSEAVSRLLKGGSQDNEVVITFDDEAMQRLEGLRGRVDAKSKVRSFGALYASSSAC
jgi:hypothetical protein